ncbi:MAG TPA: hypothetical protein VFT64_07055 [Rickettsiales bacterium]|nr:hypothetical protein [Rickettsiales bacterium]
MPEEALDRLSFANAPQIPTPELLTIVDNLCRGSITHPENSAKWQKVIDRINETLGPEKSITVLTPDAIGHLPARENLRFSDLGRICVEAASELSPEAMHKLMLGIHGRVSDAGETNEALAWGNLLNMISSVIDRHWAPEKHSALIELERVNSPSQSSAWLQRANTGLIYCENKKEIIDFITSLSPQERQRMEGTRDTRIIGLDKGHTVTFPLIGKAGVVERLEKNWNKVHPRDQNLPDTQLLYEGIYKLVKAAKEKADKEHKPLRIIIGETHLDRTALLPMAMLTLACKRAGIHTVGVELFPRLPDTEEQAGKQSSPLQQTNPPEVPTQRTDSEKDWPQSRLDHATILDFETTLENIRQCGEKYLSEKDDAHSFCPGAARKNFEFIMQLAYRENMQSLPNDPLGQLAYRAETTKEEMTTTREGAMKTWITDTKGSYAAMYGSYHLGNLLQQGVYNDPDAVYLPLNLSQSIDIARESFESGTQEGIAQPNFLFAADLQRGGLEKIQFGQINHLVVEGYCRTAEIALNAAIAADRAFERKEFCRKMGIPTMSEGRSR